MAWSKGPRCGVNNCPSRFYTVLDGRRVCQNGHVSQAAELVEDEGNVIVTKKLRPDSQLSQSQASFAKEEDESEAYLVGADLQREYVRCGKILLRTQISVLTGIYSLPKELEHVARVFFITYVNHANAGSLGSTSFYILDTVLILKAAFVTMNIPIYFIDLLRLIRKGTLPYMNLNVIADLMGETFHRIPQYMMPDTLPSFEPANKRLSVITNLLIKEGLYSQMSKFRIEPLIYKIVVDLMLPPAVYTGAVNLAHSYVTTMHHWGSWSLNNERYGLLLVCMSLKLLYAVEDNKKARDAVDWEVWADLMVKVWQFSADFYDEDENDVRFWGPEKVKKFIADYRTLTTAYNPIKPSPLVNRLFGMFPLEPLDDTDEGADNEDQRVHKELFLALHETVDEYPNDLPIGCKFVLYSPEEFSQWILPPVVEVLYETCARFIGTSPDQFRQLAGNMDGHIVSAITRELLLKGLHPHETS